MKENSGKRLKGVASKRSKRTRIFIKIFLFRHGTQQNIKLTQVQAKKICFNDVFNKAFKMASQDIITAF
jgi:hypothetical protein